jgi:hypothetical protein
MSSTPVDGDNGAQEDASDVADAPELPEHPGPAASQPEDDRQIIMDDARDDDSLPQLQADWEGYVKATPNSDAEVESEDSISTINQHGGSVDDTVSIPDDTPSVQVPVWQSYVGFL